jgi:hypothetical protein
LDESLGVVLAQKNELSGTPPMVTRRAGSRNWLVTNVPGGSFASASIFAKIGAMQVLSDQQALANIAANVTALIGDRSYSEVARECSTPTERAYPATIERICKGKHMPGAGLLARLAESLGVSVDDLLWAQAPKKKFQKIAG